MAIVNLPKAQFEKDIGKIDEKMQQKISMFGTPFEKIEDENIQIEVFPNRPDLLSYQGFKRAFLGFLGKKTGLKEYKINPPEKNYNVLIESSVKEVRPFTSCAIVKGLKLDDQKIKELIEMQEKIHATIGRKRKKLAIGIYPLEKIKLPITYEAIEPDKIKFAPLDSEKIMSGLEILQKHPKGLEYAHLLAGKIKFPIFIDADKNILSMPPIINSNTTGKITKETTEVFVECSGFDSEILDKCLNIIVTTLAEMDGKIYQMEIIGSKKRKTPEFNTEKRKLSIENINKLLGLELSEKEIKTLLEKMGHNYSNKIVEIAPWRTDILHEVDLIEDIAIAYGYENFIPEIPKISTIGKEDPKEIIKKKIAEILTGLGYLETCNYHLTNRKDQFINMGLNEKQIKNFVEVENSKTEYDILRKDLSHYIMKIFSENVDSEYPQRIFEIGKTFELKEEIIEKEKLSIGITPGNFTDIKQTIEYLFKMLDKKIIFQEAKNPPGYFIEGRVAEMILEEKSIGYLGEIHPKILKNWKIKMPVSLCEIDIDEILNK